MKYERDVKPAGRRPCKSRRRKIGRLFLIAVGIAAAGLLGADVYVGSFSRGRLYDSAGEVPHRRAALVLGCSRETDGQPNLYYRFRLDAAEALWRAGTIDAILVSGDNSRVDYDEPGSMKADLVERGVPAAYITVDCAGFRTLDSVIRAKEVFGLEEYIVVSQPFHCQRAVYLAAKKGQSVIGYCAADVGGGSGVRVRVRETLARAAAILDVLGSKRARFLGRREEIRYRTAGPGVMEEAGEGEK